MLRVKCRRLQDIGLFSAHVRRCGRPGGEAPHRNADNDAPPQAPGEPSLARHCSKWHIQFKRGFLPLAASHVVHHLGVRVRKKRRIALLRVRRRFRYLYNSLRGADGNGATATTPEDSQMLFAELMSNVKTTFNKFIQIPKGILAIICWCLLLTNSRRVSPFQEVLESLFTFK